MCWSAERLHTGPGPPRHRTSIARARRRYGGAERVHLALTADGAVARLYVNGVERAARPITGPVVHSPRPILIGADASFGAGPDADFLDGFIDEVKIETVARDPAWIQADYLAMRDLLIEYGPVDP